MPTTEKSPEFYKHYPALFQAYFPTVSAETLRLLCKAGYTYYNAVLCLDVLVDEGETKTLVEMLSLQEETIKILTSIYGYESPFWALWQQRKAEYFKAIQTEKRLLTTAEVSFEQYSSLADDKAAFGKIAIDSLWLQSHSQDKAIYEKLLLSHRYFSVGFQLYDDVKDFARDIRRGQFNWAVHQLQKVINFAEVQHDTRTLHKYLFVKGVGQDLLREAMVQFEKAKAVVAELNVNSKWLQTIEEMLTTIQGYLETTEGYLAVLKTTLALKKEQNTTPFFDFSSVKEEAVYKGLAFIECDFRQHYAELKHTMYLGNAEGFTNTQQVHTSDTFQRALLDDALFTIAQKYHLPIANFFEEEYRYFMGRINPEVGAWQYFPTVQEIAPDIDDLAQVMQFFIHTGKKDEIAKHCQKAIDTAINCRTNANGGIETWILPKHNLTPLQQKQQLFNESKWGTGPDVEVVANFLYALHCYRSEAYLPTIERGIAYLLSQQKAEGYWESRWYYGNYYGTYVCVRLLQCFGERYTNEIQRAVTYIKNNLPTEPLSMALALLTLKTVELHTDEATITLQNQLLTTQNTLGGWEAINFIKPKVYEPYKSETLTTAYALKALCL
ncbi:hypothetical protein RCZ04_22560 [Capnocytophaga sp. HP1101]